MFRLFSPLGRLFSGCFGRFRRCTRLFLVASVVFAGSCSQSRTTETTETTESCCFRSAPWEPVLFNAVAKATKRTKSTRSARCSQARCSRVSVRSRYVRCRQLLASPREKQRKQPKQRKQRLQPQAVKKDRLPAANFKTKKQPRDRAQRQHMHVPL